MAKKFKVAESKGPESHLLSPTNWGPLVMAEWDDEKPRVDDTGLSRCSRA